MSRDNLDNETLLSQTQREGSHDVLPPVYGNSHDMEGLEEEFKSFNDSNVRLGFIRKVYSLLFCQLICTTGVVAGFLYVPNAQNFVQSNPWTIWLAFGTTFGLILTLSCYEDARRRSPHNYIFLAVFTLAESYLVGVITTAFEVHQVLMALFITLGIVVALTAFAFQTKYDFTLWNGALFSCLIALMIFGVLSIFIRNRIMDLVYSSCGALLFSFYIIYDTQMIVGGEHKLQISSEEYVFAALTLYLDVINLFIFILRLLGSGNRR